MKLWLYSVASGIKNDINIWIELIQIVIHIIYIVYKLTATLDAMKQLKNNLAVSTDSLPSDDGFSPSTY